MSSILNDIVERHADEAAFLWQRHERSARSPLFDLQSLGAVDARLAANLEGLRVAGAEGLQIAVAAFDRATRDTKGPDGELFAAAYVAAELKDHLALSKLIVFAQRGGRHERALVSALAWLEDPTARRVVSELLSNECPPVLHRLGIAASAARRQDPGVALGRALDTRDPELRACAYRAAGHLGRRDLLPALRLAARNPDDGDRAWAAWAAVLLGDRGCLDILWAAVGAHGDVQLPATDLAARVGETGKTAEKLTALSTSEQTLPAALVGAGALGDPSCIPWVLETIARRPAFARSAASVYVTITGVKADPPLFVREPTREPHDDEVALHLGDPNDDLPTPMSDELQAHWAIARSQFREGERYLGGRPLTPAWLRQCLREGLQPWRASAAIELSLGSADKLLFPVFAPQRLQKALLVQAARTSIELPRV